MPRRKTVDTDALKEVILKFKSDIVKENGNIALKSDEIWNRISRDLEGKLTPVAVYTIIKKNRYDIWDLLKLKWDTAFKENVTTYKDESNKESNENSEVSSNDFEAYVKFECKVSFEEFSSMVKKNVYKCSDKSRKNKFRNYLTLKEGWTHKINDIVIKHTTFPCTLAFKRVKIYSEGIHYAVIDAKCNDCSSTLKGLIWEKPVQDKDVVITFCYTGNFQKPHLMNIKRPLSNIVREKAVTEMLKTNVAPSAYRSIKAHESEEREFNTIPSTNVLRVAKYDFLRSSRVHKDPILALGILKRSVPCEGVIRDIGYDLFFTHYWSESQIHTYNEYCKRSTQSMIAIDATGSVCQKIKRPGCKSRHIFLYEITVPSKEAGCQYAAANMLSEKHDANIIHYWIKEWQRSGALKPDIVVCDMSLALLSAAAKAFTQYSTLNDYLAQCFKLLFQEAEQNIDIPKTFIRCDVAHFIKLVSRWESLRGQIKRNRQFYLRVMAQAVQADNIDRLKQIIYATVTIALSETEGNDGLGNPVPCEICKSFLKNLIGGGNLQAEKVNLLLEENSSNVIQENSKKLRKKKKETFLEWVKNLIKKSKNQIDNNYGDRGNQQYLPKIIDDFVKICKFIPLWTGIMLPFFGKGGKTVSSTCVESSFNNLKNRIFSAEELPARVDDFILKHIKAIDGSLKLLTHENYSKPVNENISEPSTINLDNKIEMVVCTTCSMEFQATQENKCIVCDRPIHFLPECSEELPGDEEDCNQKRRCKKCISKQEFESEHKEMMATENWRGLGLPPKKRIRSSYLTQNREWIDIDLSTVKTVKSVGLIKNGIFIKPIRLENELYILTNTCAFDSIASLLCTAYINSLNFKNMIVEDDASIYEFVKDLATSGVNSTIFNIYRKRMEILHT